MGAGILNPKPVRGSESEFLIARSASNDAQAGKLNRFM